VAYTRAGRVESFAWLRYMEFPYLGPGLLVKWGCPPSLYNLIDPVVVKRVIIETPRGAALGALVVGEEPQSMHGAALPLPLRRLGPGLYRVGLELDNGVYTVARMKGYGGFVTLHVYGGKREAQEMGMTPLESVRVRGYATTHLVLGYEDKTVIAAPEPLGFPLEIVPLAASNIHEPGEAVEVQVLRNGEPLAGAAVRTIHIDGSVSITEANDSGVAVVKTGPTVTVVAATVEEPAPSGKDYDRVRLTATLSIQALTV